MRRIHLRLLFSVFLQAEGNNFRNSIFEIPSQISKRRISLNSYQIFGETCTIVLVRVPTKSLLVTQIPVRHKYSRK